MLTGVKTWRGIVTAVLLAVVLTGCTAPDEVTDEELTAWMDGLERDLPPGAGMLAGVAENMAEAEPGTGSSLDIGGIDVHTIEFSCFGVERMTVDLTITQGPVTGSSRQKEFVCDDGPHIVLEHLPEVTEVMANGVEATGEGAWAVIVRGER